MEEIEIRQARPEDAEAFLQYLRQVGGETDNLTFGAEGLPCTVEQESAYIQNTIDDPRTLLLAAWRGDRLVGDANLTPLSRRMGHRAELGVSVIRDEWGNGVGTRLLQRLVDFAREAGIELVELTVRSDNARAIALYEKFGFRRIATYPDYLKINGRYADADFMLLDLRS